jgi:hypothetical protein
VCVADALYMLLGVTPANKGAEVLCMLEMWRDRQLSLGSSIYEEVMYMATNVWEPSGLGESSTRLVQILDKMKQDKIVGYVRNPTTIPLAEAARSVLHKSIEETYAFTKGIQLISCPTVDAGNPLSSQDQSAGSTAVSQDPHPRANARHIAEFDHAASVDGAPHVGHRAALEGTADDVIEEHADFFTAAPKDEGNFSRQNKARYVRQMSVGSAARPRTISARDLVQIESYGGGGYSVVQIVPGLHPVLRSPGDSCNIPVLQQKSLGRRDSLEKSSEITHSKIDRIFSNNGATWEHLNQLPAGSTLMGNGFYLRKSSDGGWVLLMGATTQEVLDHPPYHLWSVLDTVRLAALDFDEQVVDVFKGIVSLAFEPKVASFFTQEENFLKMLQKIRRHSVIASDTARASGGSDLPERTWYLEYLERELTICQHINDVLSKIRDESSGKQGSATVVSTFKSGDLEKSLSVPVKSTEHWTNDICKVLGLLVGIRNWVPRSQLIFTLELVIRNSQSMIQKLERQIGGPDKKCDSAFCEENDENEQDDDSVGSEGVQYDIFADDDANSHSLVEGGAESRGASSRVPMAPRQLEFSNIEIQNRLIAAHEHITQRKFNQESVKILENMTERKRFKNRVEWTQHFEDSDSEDESKAPADIKRRSRKGRDTGDESDEDDQVVDDAHKIRTLASAVHLKDEFDDDELDLPLRTECDMEHESLFPSTWGYGAPVFSSFCATSIMSEHIPMYHVPINVRGLKITYSDSEGMPVAFLFHKAILRRSLKEFVNEAGYSVFLNEALRRGPVSTANAAAEKKEIAPRAEEEEEEEFEGVSYTASVSALLASGWTLHMQRPYSHATRLKELDPGQGTWMIVGAREAGSDQMILAATAKREDVLRRTCGQKETHLANGVYWYCWEGKSFGFAGNADIELGTGDTSSAGGDEHRLSWHIDGNGGWRAGSRKQLNSCQKHEKLIFVKTCVKQDDDSRSCGSDDEQDDDSVGSDDDQGDRAQRSEEEVEEKMSEEEVEERMKAEWNELSADEKKYYAQREEEIASTSRRANYRMLAYREELLRWLVDLVRSPLPTAAIHWFLDKLENGATTQSVPSLTSSVNANGQASENEIGGNLNLLVIAHCIAKALPSPNEAKSLFSSAFHIPLSFLRFTNRKNDIYGIHIVRGGTLKELQDHGAVVEVCDLGYDALTRSKDNASMYLSIIKLFSKFIWLVYVIGLDTIDDALLKWLAEYTRAHPWRFVYLEVSLEVDTHLRAHIHSHLHIYKHTHTHTHTEYSN